MILELRVLGREFSQTSPILLTLRGYPTVDGMGLSFPFRQNMALGILFYDPHKPHILST